MNYEQTACLGGVQSSKVAGNWFNKGGKDRQKNRAKTFQGIADAMADSMAVSDVDNVEIESVRTQDEEMK